MSSPALKKMEHHQSKAYEGGLYYNDLKLTIGEAAWAEFKAWINTFTGDSGAPEQINTKFSEKTWTYAEVQMVMLAFEIAEQTVQSMAAIAEIQKESMPKGRRPS